MGTVNGSVRVYICMYIYIYIYIYVVPTLHSRGVPGPLGFAA